MTTTPAVSPTMRDWLIRLLENGPALHPSPWGTIQALMRRGLVCTTARPELIDLTPAGRQLAERLVAERDAVLALGRAVERSPELTEPPPDTTQQKGTPMTLDKQKEILARIIATFPPCFALRAHEGVFRVSELSSYFPRLDSTIPTLYTQRLRPNGDWKDFAKGSEAELRSQMIPLDRGELIDALALSTLGCARSKGRHDGLYLADGSRAADWSRSEELQYMAERCMDHTDWRDADLGTAVYDACVAQLRQHIDGTEQPPTPEPAALQTAGAGPASMLLAAMLQRAASQLDVELRHVRIGFQVDDHDDQPIWTLELQQPDGRDPWVGYGNDPDQALEALLEVQRIQTATSRTSGGNL